MMAAILQVLLVTPIIVITVVAAGMAGAYLAVKMRDLIASSEDHWQQ